MFKPKLRDGRFELPAWKYCLQTFSNILVFKNCKFEFYQIKKINEPKNSGLKLWWHKVLRF